MVCYALALAIEALRGREAPMGRSDGWTLSAISRAFGPGRLLECRHNPLNIRLEDHYASIFGGA